MAGQVTALAEHGVSPTGSDAARSQKLTKSAREFEAILLTSWLEKMNQSFSGLEHSDDAAHDTLSSLGTQAIAGAIAAHGGIGIADLILRKLQIQPSQTAAADTESEGQSAAASQPEPDGRSGLNRIKTLKSSQELPITKLQSNSWNEVQR